LRELIKYTLLTLTGSLALMAIFEPWSHTYQMLLTEAISALHPDTTFGWLVRFPGAAGWAGFIGFAGLVTLFAEELFFRGWLFQWLQKRMSSTKAVFWQATLFTLPQMLAAFLLAPLQGVLYAVVYSWLAIGLIGGWAASRTQSIWPSLLSATLYNIIMCTLSL
jgi:membrane protease YdiL (CAAX protease family)